MIVKMFMHDPKPKGLPCPDGFKVVKYCGEEDIPAWIEICKDGSNALIGEDCDGFDKFRRELIDIDGPDPLRDTYFIEHEGEKVATFTVVPNMWSTGMGYIHMVACKQKCRGKGIGKFISDYAVKLLCDIGKKKLFLLTTPERIAALSCYIKEGFIAGDDGRTPEQTEAQLKAWQEIVNTLQLPSMDFYDFDGEKIITTIYRTK